VLRHLERRQSLVRLDLRIELPAQLLVILDLRITLRQHLNLLLQRTVQVLLQLQSIDDAHYEDIIRLDQDME
jgi:hypothetical protein